MRGVPLRKLACLIGIIVLSGCGGGGGSSGEPPAFRVVSASPANHQAEIPIGSAIRVSFNRDVDPSTIASGISARSFIDDSPLPGTYSYDSPTKTATFSPNPPLAPLTEYTVTVGADIRSAGGEPLSAEYTCRFTTESSFWAYDFTNPANPMYLVPVTKVAEGAYCRIYLENGKSVSQTAIDRVVDEFDRVIHPGVVGNFGDEPNPGADGIPKIFIVLLDIRDGYTPGGAAIGGYFYSVNELPNAAAYPFGSPSNQKETFFMDIHPGDPSRPSFYNTLAHEFQHMVHWEQKANRLGLRDDTWLDEAMSEIAPHCVGYGPSYGRVAIFESGTNRSDSLTDWGGGLKDYAVAYMWAQYMADRYPAGIFRSILASSATGIASVESYLGASFPETDFSSVFRDWSIAVFSGKDLAWTGHPEWSYRSISTRQGTYGGIQLPGITTTNNLNVDHLPALPPWSVGYYWYTSQSADPAFTWNPSAPPVPWSSFYDWTTGGALSFDMVPGIPYRYGDAAVLMLQNACGSYAGSSTPVNLSVQGAHSALPSPLAKLAAVSENKTSKRLSAATGEPAWVCMQDHLAERGKILRGKIERKRNGR